MKRVTRETTHKAERAERPAWNLRFSRWRVTALGPLNNAVTYVVDAADDGSAADVVFLATSEDTIVGIERIGLAVPPTKNEEVFFKGMERMLRAAAEREDSDTWPPPWHVYLGAARYVERVASAESN